MDNESLLEFNFWTAFADLMLALVLVLCVLLFVIIVVISVGTVDLQKVKTNQNFMVDSIAQKYGVKPHQIKENTFGISTMKDSNYDIQIQNDLNSQRITFSDKLLFLPDRTEINSNGQAVIDAVGSILKSQLSSIKEIQVQGHADTLKSNRFKSNTDLAAQRAISVLEYLQDKDKVGIDPSIYLMSATSFGEFKPVQRTSESTDYNRDKIDQANADEPLRSRNRRIELVLIYRR